MKKSSTATTTMSLPTSPTISAHTITGSKLSLSSTKTATSGRSSRTSLQSPQRKKSDLELESILEKAKFYTSLCLGECDKWKGEVIFSYFKSNYQISHYYLVFDRIICILVHKLKLHFYRNHCNSVGFCIPLFNTIRRGSSYIDNNCRLWSRTSYMYCHWSCLRGRHKKLFVEFMPRGLHVITHQVSIMCIYERIESDSYNI